MCIIKVEDGVLLVGANSGLNAVCQERLHKLAASATAQAWQAWFFFEPQVYNSMCGLSAIKEVSPLFFTFNFYINQSIKIINYIVPLKTLHRDTLPA